MGIFILSTLATKHSVSEAKAATHSVFFSSPKTKNNKKTPLYARYASSNLFVIPPSFFCRRDLTSKKRQVRHAKSASRPALLIRLIRRRAAPSNHPSFPENRIREEECTTFSTSCTRTCHRQSGPGRRSGSRTRGQCQGRGGCLCWEHR